MDEYLGYKEVTLSGEQLSYIFSNEPDNIFDCLENEYLIAKDESGNVVSVQKCRDGKLTPINSAPINTKSQGKVKARNVEQRLAIDMLLDKNTNIKMLKGKAGGGKDFLITAAAMFLMERGIFQKIVFVRNNVDVRDSKPIGYLPGSSDDKLMPYVMPFADKVGGADVVKEMIESGVFEIAHFAHIRGRSFENCIVICCEAENMTADNMRLLTTRIGENSILIVNGDTDQIDLDVFVRNNGMTAMANGLKGNPLFGCVTLRKTERSATAALAELIR